MTHQGQVFHMCARASAFSERLVIPYLSLSSPLSPLCPSHYYFFLFFIFINKVFIFFYKFIYLFLAALGLCCCARAFSSCGEWELPFVVVRGLLIAVASLVAEHRL